MLVFCKRIVQYLCDLWCVLLLRVCVTNFVNKCVNQISCELCTFINKDKIYNSSICIFFNLIIIQDRAQCGLRVAGFIICGSVASFIG